MTFLNNILHNDFIFIPLWIGVGGTIAWAWWSETTRVFSSVNPMTSGTPGLETVSQSTLTPQTFHITQDQLMSIPNYSEQGVQTEPSLDGLFIPISEKGVQVVSKVNSIGVQVNPPLTIDTATLDTVSVFRNIDMSDLTSVFISQTSDSIQAVPEVKSAGVQTISDISSRTVTIGPRTTLQEVFENQNFRYNHWERKWSSSEIRDSQISLIEQLVQTDSQISLMEQAVQTMPSPLTVQTLFDRMEQGIQTFPNPDFMVNSFNY